MELATPVAYDDACHSSDGEVTSCFPSRGFQKAPTADLEKMALSSTGNPRERTAL